MDYNLITLNDIEKNTDSRQEECRIRIFGKVLGSTQDIISLWESIEKNYINIMACNRLIEDFASRDDGLRMPYPLVTSRIKLKLYNKTFMDYYEKYDIIDIISSDEYPIITKINFNSPGFWEVIGKWNIFEQLRKYIQERHLRNRDKKYAWDLDRKKQMVEIESQQLSNDLLKLDITQKMIIQLKQIGLSDIEIRHVVQKSYGSLELLNSHIDNDRIVEIKKVDIYNDRS